MIYKGYSIKKYSKNSVYFGYEIKNKINQKTFIDANTIEDAKIQIDKLLNK